MKKHYFGTFASFVLIASLLLSSCKSSEISDTAATIANGNFGGIMLDTAGTAETAAAIPVLTTAAVPMTSDITEITEISEDTTVTAAETALAETAPAATITQTTTTQATAAVTTTQTTTTAATTTQATTAATTTQATTAATTTQATTAATTTRATTQTTAAADEAEKPLTGGNYTKNSYSALNYDNVKAVWISYIEINNLLLGKSESSFRQSIGNIYDNCTSLGINTVYVHTRSYGDAFYYSKLFPFTKYISGSLGTKTAYDPLKIMVDEAHKRKISFHAWINPLRLCNAADMPTVSSEYPEGKWYSSDKKGKYIVNVNNVWFLNPAYDETIKLIGDGVREIVSGYDVDGIHIDDYFYPTTDASFDSTAFAASGYSSLSQYRINRCNAMIKEMYNATHECGSAVFGAAPQGNNINNLNVLYADTRAWCSGGYIDYFTPQVYYGFENSGVPFKKCVDEWCSIVSGTKTKLCIGLSLYKIGNEDTWAGSGKYEWQNTDTMIKRQIEYAHSKNVGVALYSYNYLFSEGYLTSAIKTEINNFKSLLK